MTFKEALIHLSVATLAIGVLVGLVVVVYAMLFIR